jgi:uncharacterized membrane protein HdeD (DUF308 family)
LRLLQAKVLSTIHRFGKNSKPAAVDRLTIGAFAPVDGVLSLIAAFTGAAKSVPTWRLAVVGLLGIGAGVVTFMWPGITPILLVLFIGAWALVHGIFEIIGAVQLRKEIDKSGC